MGKASKRVKRNAQKTADLRKIRECQPLEVELDMAFSAEEYTKVLEILAELIQAKDIKADFLYKGAYSYFMLGDFDRAVQWVDNTLNYDSHNVDARILLARICFMQDRHEDGLAIYDFLLATYRQTMSQEQKDQITDSSEFYVMREADIIRNKYPHLADFLNLGKAEDDQQLALSSVTEEMPMLQQLKSKLREIQEETTERIEDSASSNIDAQIVAVQQKECSLREKVRIFNTFAAAQYMMGDYAGAAAYLKVALQVDDGDVETLRNMAMVQAALGDYVAAQTLATKLPEVDFVLLYMLREQAESK